MAAEIRKSSSPGIGRMADKGNVCVVGCLAEGDSADGVGGKGRGSADTVR